MKQARVYSVLVSAFMGVYTCSAMAATSSAELNWQWSLADLDPDDGIAPSIEFHPYPDGVAGGRTLAGGNEYSLTEDRYVQILNDEKTSPLGTSPFVDGQSSVTGNRFNALAVLEAGTNSQTLRASGASQMTPDPIGGHTSYAAQAQSLGLASRYFILSPLTSATFYGVAKLSAGTSTVPDERHLENATAGYNMNVVGRPIDGVEWTVNQFSGKGLSAPGVRFDPVTHNYEFLTKDEWQGDVSVTIFNSNTTPMFGAFTALVQVDGTSSVLPVPEPESMALLLAGGGLAAWWARRRRVGPGMEA